MKKLFSLVFLAFLLFGCKSEKKKEANIVSENKPVDTTVNPLDSYAVFIKSLDTTDVTSVSGAAKEFAQQFQKADTTKADSAFVLFSRMYDKIESNLNEQHIKDSSNYDAYVSESADVKAAKTPRADAHVKKLKENGFTIGTAEGSTFIKQDRSFLSKYFYPYISSALKEYLVQVNKENEEGFIDDGGLVITPLELSNRVLWWEGFLQNHPSFVFAPEIKEKQKGNITFLLEGIDNTPLLDYSTKTLQEDYKKAFESVLKNNPQSSTAGIIKPYYEALKQKDTKKARKLLLQYKKQGIMYDYSA